MSQPPANIPVPPSIPFSPPAQPPASPPTTDPGGLTHEQLIAIQRGHEGARKIRRAVNVANADAAFMILSSFFCIASTCILGMINLVVGVALAFVAFNSTRGALRLKKFDRTAPKLLALNQVYLTAIIILYCVGQIWSVHSAAAKGGMTDPQLQELFRGTGIDPSMATEAAGLGNTLVVTVCIALIPATIIFQGLTGLYYYTRGRLLENYLEETPPWVIEVQKRQTSK